MPRRSKHKRPLAPPVKYDVVTSGEGPFGLASAWEAAQSGKSVLMVANRKMEYVRVQRVFLQPENREYLLSMLGGKLNELKSPEDDKDIKFLKELIEGTTIAIKDIERFIKRRLDELKKDGRNITYLEESQISKIKMKKGVLNTKPHDEAGQERQFEFDYVIGADGASHPSANVFNKNAKKNNLVTYCPISQPKHPFHASVNVTIERKDGNKLELPEKQFISDSTSTGWAISFDTLSKSFDGKKVKSTFGGEIPEELFNLINDYNKKDISKTAKKRTIKKITEHIKGLIQSYFKKAGINDDAELIVTLVKPSAKYGRKKDKMKLQTFMTNFSRANVAAVEIEGRVFIVGADAYRTPNYQFGHGINHAFEHSRKVGQIFRGQKTIAQHNSECKFLSRVIEFGTKLTNYYPFRNFLGWGAETAAERKRKDFLKKHETLLDKLKKLTTKAEEEQMQDHSYQGEKASLLPESPLTFLRMR